MKEGKITKIEHKITQFNGNTFEKELIHVMYTDLTVEVFQAQKLEDIMNIARVSDKSQLEGKRVQIDGFWRNQNHKYRTVSIIIV